MPSAAVSTRFSLAARMSTPKRVRVTSIESAKRTIGPTAIRKRSYWGTGWPASETVPLKPGARGPRRSVAPNAARTASRTMSTTPKVAVSWSSSGAAYNRFSRTTSMSAPMAATATAATITPTQNDAPPRPNAPASSSPAAYARYAPSMNSEPCAKLTMRVTPKISVSPAATRKSADADDSPFKSCSRNDASVTAYCCGRILRTSASVGR
jgi:hypothetical protein